MLRGFDSRRLHEIGVTADVPFYVGLARDADGPLVELAVGDGRVAIPVAQATRRRVIGIDSSPAMLAQARVRAVEEGVELDLREGDIRELEIEEPAALDRLEENYRERLGPRRPTAIAWYAAEEDNLRAMLDHLSETAPIEAVRAAYVLHPFWMARGAYTEERERFRALEARRDLPPQERAMVLVRLSEVESRLGNVEAAEAADREAASPAKPGSEAYWITLVDLAIHAARRGENDEAVVLAERAVEDARKRDDFSRLNAMGSLSGVLMEVGRTDEARAILERFIEDARRSGLTVFETLGLVDLARLDLLGAEYESSRAAFTEGLKQLRGVGNKTEEIESLKGLGYSLLGLRAARRGARRVPRSARTRAGIEPDVLG